MKTMRFGIDHVTMIMLAMTATLPFLALSPVDAATPDCQDQYQAVRIEADAAEPAAAAKALRTARLAEKICIEGNRFEAGRKFTLARKQLGPDVQIADRR